MSTTPLHVDRPADGVLRLRLNRPRRRNAIDGELLGLLVQALGSAVEPVVILGSTGRESFCAGGDLHLDPDELGRVSEGLYELYESLVVLPAVVVAAADGPAVGAGAQMLLAADVRIGGPGCRISFLGAESGLTVGTWALPGLVGWGRASDLCLTGRFIEPDEAVAIGLLDRLVEDPGAEAVALGARLAGAPEGSAARTKLSLREGEGAVERLRRERDLNAGRTHTEAGSRARGRKA